MRRRLVVLFLLLCCIAERGYAQLRPFLIRYVSSDVVYIQGGTAAGLKVGMRLNVKRPKPGEAPLLAPSVAELIVISVASTSAACEIARSSVSLQPGDEAFISATDLEQQIAASSETEAFAQIVEFTDSNTLEEELRDSVPRPALREIDRFSGRIGFEQDSIVDRSGRGQNSNQQGITFRFDFTRIGSSHWNLEGYWRARISRRKRPVEQESLSDVMHRVYEFGLRYDNPQSRLVLGIGRLMVPWASSLSTLDGGYFAVRVRPKVTVGAFAGTTPNPSAWNYDPRRQLGGGFVSVEHGNFEHIRHTLSTGIAVTRLDWKPERQFLFVENGMLVGRAVSFHHNLEADYRSADRFASTRSVSLTRSYSTIRVQPVSRLSVDVGYNYFRVLPTPDERLIVTQQLGNLLFRGLNGGARLDLPHAVSVYANAGRSSRTGDSGPSWSGMTGVSMRVPKSGMRAEARFSRFRGTVANGNYRSISFRTETSARWRLELEGGDQRLDSPLLTENHTWYGMGTVDVFVGRFVLGVRGMRYLGSAQKYDQLRGSLDFRF